MARMWQETGVNWMENVNFTRLTTRYWRNLQACSKELHRDRGDQRSTKRKDNRSVDCQWSGSPRGSDPVRMQLPVTKCYPSHHEGPKRVAGPNEGV